MIVPHEITLAYRKAKCPICESFLTEDNGVLSKSFVVDSDNKIYTAVAWCPEDTAHYELQFEWEDPKFFSKSEESITFYDEKKQYTIKISYLNEEVIWTHITTIPLDECGSLDEEGKKYDRLLEGKYFDFSKFDIDRYIFRIRTIIVFE